MKFSNLFGRRVNRVFAIGIKNSTIPYPENRDTRWEVYGSPLASIFSQYFDEIALGYFKNSGGHLDRIDVTCYKSRFKCKEHEDDEINAKLFKVFDNAVKGFFEQFNANAKIIDVHPTTASSAMKQAVEYALDKIKSGDNVGLETEKESNLEKVFEPAIMTTPEGKEELAVNLNIKVDPSDIEEEGMTLHRSEDGRYFVGCISKTSGKRRYVEIPESVAQKLGGKVDNK